MFDWFRMKLQFVSVYQDGLWLRFVLQSTLSPFLACYRLFFQELLYSLFSFHIVLCVFPNSEKMHKKNESFQGERAFSSGFDTIFWLELRVFIRLQLPYLYTLFQSAHF